jgi:large subunit ribosomal protein L18
MDTKVLRRQKLRFRIRKSINGTAESPRLAVFRSNKTIYAQLIDDTKRVNIASASSASKEIAKTVKVEQSKLVGEAIAKLAASKGITKCVFDRGGYLYHGRVKALAEGARAGGLQF